MDFVLKERITIGVSACNDGAKVRWNRAGWDRVEKLGREKDSYTWAPVCPEVLSGLGVPREPMKLTGGNGDDFWAGSARLRNKKGRDVTGDVKSGALAALECVRRSRCEAFAFMEGSPSCGVYRTTLKDRRLGKPPGVFGALLFKEGLFLIPALDLESPWKWWDWSRRLHAFVWLRRQEFREKKELYEAWHALKFLCQEADVGEAAVIGQSLAACPKKRDDRWVADWKGRVLSLLRRPSTLRRIQAVMAKHYAHYRKHFNPASDVRPPSGLLNKTAFVEELRRMELRAFQEGYLFAGRPVAYRPGR